MNNEYNSLWYEFAKKWQFYDGLRGVIGSYMFCQSNGKYCLYLWVSDKRYLDKRKTKKIFSTDSANKMRNYLTAYKPENNK